MYEAAFAFDVCQMCHNTDVGIGTKSADFNTLQYFDFVYGLSNIKDFIYTTVSDGKPTYLYLFRIFSLLNGITTNNSLECCLTLAISSTLNTPSSI